MQDTQADSATARANIQRLRIITRPTNVMWENTTGYAKRQHESERHC